MSKLFTIPSVSNWNLEAGLYAQLEGDYGRSELTEFSSDSP
jgi:hypothetical protein